MNQLRALALVATLVLGVNLVVEDGLAGYVGAVLLGVFVAIMESRRAT